MEISTQFDPALSQKLTYIRQKTHQELADIIRRSVELYYEKLCSQESPNEKLLKSNFVGCEEGEPSLSQNYKEVLSQSWDSKYDHR